MRKVPRKNCYRVSKRYSKKSLNTSKNAKKSTKTRKVFSKCATRENAIKQMKLLRALQFNKNFIPRPKTK